MTELVTGEPVVKLLAYTPKPFDLAVASARSCYSPRLVFADEVTEQQRERIGKSIFEAGHHTPFHHPAFVFGLENVSRQFVWSFLHAHPYYNSDQSSQRYVLLKEARVFLPNLDGGNRELYKKTVLDAWNAYNKISQLLAKDFAGLMESIGRIKGQSEKQIRTEAEKKAIETARYLIPVAAFTSLYHTVSGVVLKRYLRMANASDCPTETRAVVEKMMAEVRKIDAAFESVGQPPLEAGNLPENHSTPDGDAFAKQFDAEMNGLSSKLAAFTPGAEEIVAQSVREALAAPGLSDDEAIDLAVNPAKNPLLTDTLNSWTHSPVMRSLNHAHYVFKKKISHSCDSQDQRHRTVPASRPLLTKTHTKEPDYVMPEAIKRNSEAAAVFEETVKMLWEAKNNLIDNGAPAESALYLLPNATAVRFTESGSFLNLMHKWRMRTCFAAQQEIYEASMQELNQVRAVHPRLSRYVGPACYYRKGLAEEKPLEGPCPEGARWCGIKVWLNFPNARRPF